MTLPLSLLAWLTHMAVFHGLGLAFAWSDRHGKLRRFKVRARDHRSYGEMLPRVLFNQCFILLPIALSCQFLGLAYVGPPHLSLAWFLAGLLLMAVGHDVVQYPAHRWLLHGRRFRWLGHDLHHSIKPACSIGACFMSGPDFFLEIVCPYLVPLILIGGGGSDVAFHLVVAGFASMGGVYEHSGYDFAAVGKHGGSAWGRLVALLPASLTSSHAHGEHHRRWTVSFSDGFLSPGLSDRLFGTSWKRVRDRA